MDKDALSKIQEIETEIISLAHLEAKLGRFIRNDATPEQIEKARTMLERIDRRIHECQIRIRALERFEINAANQLDLLLRREPIEVPHLVTFFGVEAIEDQQMRAAA